jgi:hypothetical protein
MIKCGMNMKVKFVLFAAVAVLMGSCTPTPVKPSSYVRYFDYLPISKEYGVNFTESDAVNFDYEALGSICAVDVPGYVQVDGKDDGKKLFAAGLYKAGSKEYEYVSKDGYSVLALLAKEAKEKGGDYILNLKITESATDPGTYIATGMLVKRK